MQPAHGPLSDEPRGELPLPPTLTQREPAPGPRDAETLVAPFVPARATRPVGAEPAIEIELTEVEEAAPAEPAVEELPWELEAETPAHTAPAPQAEEEPRTQTPEPWVVEPGFPLDALIRPEGTQPAPSAHQELAEATADRLEALAARLRAEGFTALIQPGSDARQLDLLVASLLAGYVVR